MGNVALRRITAIVLVCGLTIIMAAPFRLAQAGQGGIEDLFAQPVETQEEVVALSAEFTAPTPREPGRLSITAMIEPTWHIYSIMQPPGGPLPTEIRLARSNSFRQVGDIRTEPLPDCKTEAAFDNLSIETHHDRVTWHIPIAIDSGVDLNTLTIEGRLRVQPCNPDTCRPPQELPFTATLAQGTKTVAPSPVSAASTTSADAFADDTAAESSGLEIVAEDESSETSLAMILGIAFLGGLILNLMPCVLPGIGLKILSFVQQAGQSRRHAIVLNVWYSLGLISVFIVLATLAVFLSFGWGQLFSFTEFNVALAAVVFVMSLSLLGVWEIPIPGLFGSGTANDLSQREGAAGAFSKGVLTTILATPCSGPFLASALAWAVGRPPMETYAVFVAVGLGMASPYLLIGAFPELIRFLPKPGAWMDTFKQLMGFVLLGTVAYLLTLIPWAMIVPTVAFLFGLWAACWWIGRTPLTSSFRRRALAWSSATAFAGLVGVVVFGWLAGVTTDRFQRTLQAASADSATAVVGQNEDELPWRPFSRKTFDELIAAEQTVLVDFTADWCMTCKTLESLVLNTPKTRDAVHHGRIAMLRADWTHAEPEVTKMLEQLGSKQVPVIAIFPAGDARHPVVLRGGYTQEMLLAALDRAGPSKPQQLTAAPQHARQM